MTQNDLGKKMDEYKQKTDLFPHPEVICKKKKNKKVVKENPTKER